MRLIAALLMLAATAASAGEVYRWVDDKGVVHYSDGPPSPNAKPVELPKLQTYQPTAPTTTIQVENAAPVKAAPITITAPQAGETIRDPDGRVSVVVNATPGDGQGLVYLLDDRPVSGPPSPSTAYLIEGVERGEHTVSAMLVDGDGHELARAAPITIYLMQPTIKSPALRR